MILILAVLEYLALVSLFALGICVPTVGITIVTYSVIGAGTFLYLDHKNEGRLFKWIDACPPQLEVLLVPQITILWGWPVLVYLHCKQGDAK